MTKSHLLHEIKDYALILVGVCLYALGFTVFMLPYGLTMGGVAGIGAIIYYATGIEVQVTYMTINVFLLAFAIKILGFRFCVKTIWAVAMLSFAMWLFQRLLETPDPANPGAMMLPRVIGDELFMASVLGSICSGLGLAFCFENNGSTGGTDIIAAIVNKYRNMSLGSVIMACDVIIISSCYFIFHDWARVIYGFVILFVASMTLDYSLRRLNQSVQFMIFSRNADAIADDLVKDGHGVTVLNGEGWYTHTDRRVVVCVVRHREKSAMLRLIKDIDPYCFVSMSDANSVWGEGFDKMKVADTRKFKSKRPLVCATNNIVKIEQAQKLLGDKYDVRSLYQIGCDTSKELYSGIFEMEAGDRCAYVKRHFGFDTFYFSHDGKTVFIEDDYYAPQFDIKRFDTLEGLMEYLEKKKK